MLDIEKARRETPSCEHILHFDNAGASLMPQPVLKAMKDHLDLEAEIGAYEAADRKQDSIEHVYDLLAQFISAKREEIAFIENATRAWDMAFYSIPFKRGDRILTATAEYGSNYVAYLQIARKTGAVIDVIPNDKSGQLSVEALKNMMDERVKLVSITHVPTNGGLVNPAVEIGKIARKANVLYLLDACQSVGQMPIDVKEIGCDMLSATGRKFLRGPRATGFLYVNSNVVESLEPPLLDMHAADWPSRDEYIIRPDARRFENWEQNYAGKIGLGVAVDYALGLGLEDIWRRVKGLADRLRAKLSTIRGINVRDLGIEKCGIVTFTSKNVDAQIIKQELAKRGINVTVSTKVWTRLDMEARNIESLVRASVHYYNTEDEIERFCQAVCEIISK
ncbi:aminotransferase class V-fold PLP-dependent enzyme [Candidatus Acetothermia bacterium]|nr:aminotransferase class V-fold PLP-dependent enzyme [Candidatus Acetothermia bacterium]MBI3644101.1 aminotransferase class V-fold PLP-dependent enzyme [Candidatus Acetothermia bacterium]